MILCPELLEKIKWKVPSARGSVTFYININTRNNVLNSSINHMLNSCNKVQNINFCNYPLQSLHIDY